MSYVYNSSGHPKNLNPSKGYISAGRATSLANSAGKVWKASGGNIMTPSKHINGQGSSRHITTSPTYSIGISKY